MRWLALEAGDAATWGSTVVTFGMACYAVAQGVTQRRDLRRQNELQAEASQLQRRQIEMTERRALAMEQLLGQLTANAGAAARPWAQPGAYGGGHTAAAAPGGGAAGHPLAGAWDAAAAPPPPPPAVDVAPEQPSEEADQAGDDETPRDRRQEVPGDPEPLRDEISDARPAAGTAEPADSEDAASSSVPAGVFGRPQSGSPAPSPPPKRRRRPKRRFPMPIGDETSGSRDGTPAGPSSPPPYQPQIPAPARSGPPFAPAGPWVVERAGRHVFALRNTGTTTLTGVRVDRAELPETARGVPEDAVVRPGETVEFLMAAGRSSALPATVRVTWHERPWGVYVPVPLG